MVELRLQKGLTLTMQHKHYREEKYDVIFNCLSEQVAYTFASSQWWLSFLQRGAELAGESSRPREMHIIISPLLAEKQQCPAGLSWALPKTEAAIGP